MGSFAPTHLTAAEESALDRVLEITRWQIAHARQVQRISTLLFDILRPLHGLGDVDGRLLLSAALLHDVGYPADPPEHHKASARVIRSHLDAPFDEREVEIIALIARYHRRTPPKLTHRRYAQFDERDRRRIGWLAGILRVADGLDRSHAESVKTVVGAHVNGRLEITARGAREEDLRGASRKRDLLGARSRDAGPAAGRLKGGAGVLLAREIPTETTRSASNRNASTLVRQGVGRACISAREMCLQGLVNPQFTKHPLWLSHAIR